MDDSTSFLLTALICSVISVLFFLVCGRIVGWLLGISKIYGNQQTIIWQNDRVIALMDKSLRVQQGIRVDWDEDGDEE